MKACLAREWILVKRNSFVYVFKALQVRCSPLICLKETPLHLVVQPGLLALVTSITLLFLSKLQVMDLCDSCKRPAENDLGSHELYRFWHMSSDAKSGFGAQMAFVAIITATLFLRTHIHRQTYTDANLLAGFLFYTLIQLFFNGIAEM